MTTTEKYTASVTTDCECTTENDETGEFGPSNECFGDCYEWQKENVFELLGMWQTLNDIDENDPILINGTGMGWMRREGYKWTTMLELHGALALDGGDFRIEWYWENGELTARRWSHDEPVGTGLFTFSHYRECDKCNTPIKADIHTEELGMCVDCSHAYFDHSDEE
jgi:hypothetical protein